MDLPIEIAHNIAQFLNKKDIFEGMQVCWSWYSGLSPVYYRQVQVISFHKQFLEQTEKSRIDGSRIGRYVRSIIFSSPYFPKCELLDKGEFCRLIGNLPYLQSIQFHDGIDCYVKFMESVHMDHLKHIQEVTVHGISKDIRGTHVSINVILKDRISKLYLDDMDVILSCPEAGKYDDFFTTLSSFKNLNHLEIYNKRMHVPNYVVSLFNACHHLISFRFKSECTYNLPSTHIQHTRLQSLHFHLKTGITCDHLDYIMNNLPNLKELRISPFSISISGISLFDLSQERSRRFLQYTQRLNVVEFRELKGRERTLFPQRLSRSSPFDIQDPLFWSYIHDLIGHESFICNLKIYLSNDSDKQAFVSMHRRNKTIEIENAWHMEKQPWTQAAQFLTFESITLVHEHPCDTSSSSINILVDLLVHNRRRGRLSPSLHLIGSFGGRRTNVTLKFVDMETFHLRQQYPTDLIKNKKSHYGEGTEALEVRDGLIDMVNKLNLGEHMLLLSHSTFNIEYWIGCQDIEK